MPMLCLRSGGRYSYEPKGDGLWHRQSCGRGVIFNVLGGFVIDKLRREDMVKEKTWGCVWVESLFCACETTGSRL